MPEFSGVKLLISDVDGTLLTRAKVLTERTQAAVRRLKQAGIRFAITSGRPPRGMAMFVDPLAIDEPIAGFNGGSYVNPDMTALETHMLGPEAASEALSHLAEAGIDAWLYSGNDWYVRDPLAPHVARERSTVQFAPQTVEDFRPLLGSVSKLVGVSDDHALVRRVDDDVRSLLGPRASVSRSQPYYLDVTHPLANKAQVVDYHARRLGLSPEAICTIGDGANDVLMFAASGFSVAMGNAVPDVQARAAAVTASCEEDGLARAIEHYLL